LGEDDLGMAAHAPRLQGTIESWCARARPATAAFNNCSASTAGFLTTAVQYGSRRAGYIKYDHR